VWRAFGRRTHRHDVRTADAEIGELVDVPAAALNREQAQCILRRQTVADGARDRAGHRVACVDAVSIELHPIAQHRPQGAAQRVRVLGSRR
jgi:hypothetical protein